MLVINIKWFLKGYWLTIKKNNSVKGLKGQRYAEGKERR